jgi:hypothetical protein
VFPDASIICFDTPYLSSDAMEGKILGSLGKVAGLGGIALGVFLLIFQGVLQKQFLPQAGLTSAQAFAIILSLMILTFGIAGIGVMAWLVSRTIGPKAPVPLPAMGTLAGLIVLIVGAATYVGAQAKLDAQSAPKVEAGQGGIAVGRDVIGTTINIGAGQTPK